LYNYIKNALGIAGEEDVIAAPVTAPAQAPVSAPVRSAEVALQPSVPTTASSPVKIGDSIPFGKYEWRVLDVQNGKALIITKDITERNMYHEKNEEITWETCTLRNYLNNEFYNHFSENDRKRILHTTVLNSNNPWYDTNGGNDTTDKVFLLSIDEVLKYFGNSQLTPYEENNPYYFSDNNNNKRIARYDGEMWEWWLRSPGCYENRAATVESGSVRIEGMDVERGMIEEGVHAGNTVIYNNGGVRPAMWISTQGNDVNAFVTPVAETEQKPSSSLKELSSAAVKPAVQSAVPDGIPEGAEFFMPKGVITAVTNGGVEMKGIANGAFAFNGSPTLNFSDLDLELPLLQIKSIKADPYGMGEAEIVMSSGVEHKVEFGSSHCISFISAEKPHSPIQLNCLEISSLVFDRETDVNANLEYILIECYDGRVLAVPNLFFEFYYFGWNPIKAMKSFSGQPVGYYWPHILLSEKAELPFEEIEIPIDEIASYQIKNMGNSWYKVVVTKKSGELISLKAYCDFEIKVCFITSTGKEELDLSGVKRITFLSSVHKNQKDTPCLT
jgi:hypothetical protein